MRCEHCGYDKRIMQHIAETIRKTDYKKRRMVADDKKVYGEVKKETVVLIRKWKAEAFDEIKRNTKGAFKDRQKLPMTVAEKVASIDEDRCAKYNLLKNRFDNLRKKYKAVVGV